MADCACKPWVEELISLVPTLLLSLLLGSPALCAASQKSNKLERPQIPFGFTALSPVEVGAYDSKAQPSAEVLQAVNAMTVKGWETISKYYPELGNISEKAGSSVNPGDPDDRRFLATFATEDPGRSPMPLVAMICSLEANEVSGRLKTLRDELLEATRVEDYSAWPADRLGQAVHEMTQVQTTIKGVKYRAPKKTLSFKETVRLYAMTVALLTIDTKWPQWEETARKLGYSLPPPPNMNDFSNRLRYQLPLIIPMGATRGMLLYRPGWDLAQPLTKDEFEERADVVLIKKTGTTFHVEQFPIYLTAEQKTWNPQWTIPEDDWKDSTLTARKFEEVWTRFDGPYMWFKSDQLNGEDTYRATVKFEKGEIVIEAERFVLRRGSVVRTARDPLYDPLNEKRFVAGTEAPADPLTVDLPALDNWPDMWRQLHKNINETCYRHDDRQLLWYKTGENSFSSSIFPLKNGGPPAVEPFRPVKIASSGIVARFSGSGAEQPNDVQLLNHEQQTSINLAVGLINLCLANASGAELAALRVAMPRDKDNLTPSYFYSVGNGTSVRRSPNSLVVVLSEGYYDSYISAFNRVLWVLESAFANDAGRNAAINRSIAEYLRGGLPKDASGRNDPAVIAWSEILQSGDVDQLFNASILPNSQKRAAPNAPTDTGHAAAESFQAGEWLLLLQPADTDQRSTLDSTQGKPAEIAVGLMDLYLAGSSGPVTEMWRQWYPRATTITFLTSATDEQGTAKEEIRETTSAQGERRTEVNLAVALPNRAYDNYLSTLVWLLGVLEVHARSRDLSGPSASASGGQGTGVLSVLDFLRHLDVEKENPTVRHLTQLGVNWKSLPGNIPGVPSMFLGAQPFASGTPATGGATSQLSATTTSPSVDARGVLRPSITALFPADLGLGPLDAPVQTMTRDLVRMMNLYLSKQEDKRDKAAEQFRQALAPVTNLYLYRNSNEAINLKQGVKSNILVGLPAKDANYPAMFVELLRVVEMQNERLTSSWDRRQDIAFSIRNFLDTYAKANPGDPVTAQLSSVDIKTLTDLK